MPPCLRSSLPIQLQPMSGAPIRSVPAQSARSRLYSATSRHCGEGKGAERVPPSLREVLSSHRASNAATVTPLLPNRSGGGTGATLHSHERFLVGSVNVLFVHMRKGAKGGINDVQVTPLTTPTLPL